MGNADRSFLAVEELRDFSGVGSCARSTAGRRPPQSAEVRATDVRPPDPCARTQYHFPLRPRVGQPLARATSVAEAPGPLVEGAGRPPRRGRSPPDRGLRIAPPDVMRVSAAARRKSAQRRASPPSPRAVSVGPFATWEARLLRSSSACRSLRPDPYRRKCQARTRARGPGRWARRGRYLGRSASARR